MFKSHLRNIHRYKTISSREENISDLSMNERVYPVHEDILSKFKTSIDSQLITRYPDLTKTYNLISEYYKVPKEQVLLVNGSEQGIKLVLESLNLNEESNIIFSNYSFPLYKVYTQIYKANFKQVKVNSIDTQPKDYIEQHKELIDVNTQLIILTNPSSPLGNKVPLTYIEDLLETGVHILVDEAYIELTDAESCCSLLDKYINLTVLRTFSKAFGAAGIRAGLVFSNENNMEYYQALRPMFEISSISAKYIEILLENINLQDEYINSLKLGKKQFVDKLKKSNIEFIDTDTTWFFIKSYQNKRDICTVFKKESIVVRKVRLPGKKVGYLKINYDIVLNKTNIIDILCDL